MMKSAEKKNSECDQCLLGGVNERCGESADPPLEWVFVCWLIYAEEEEESMLLALEWVMIMFEVGEMDLRVVCVDESNTDALGVCGIDSGVLLILLLFILEEEDDDDEKEEEESERLFLRLSCSVCCVGVTICFCASDE